MDDEDDDLVSVHERLDDLTRQLARMAQAGFAQASAPAPAPVFATAPPPPREPAPAADPRAPDRVAEALARLDRRLDQVIAEGRQVTQDVGRQPQRYAPPPRPAAPPQFQTMPPQPPAPPPPAPKRGPTSWAEQISARQRALDGVPAQAAPARAPVAPAAPEPAAWNPAHDLAGVQQQLYELNHQISSLHHPYENAINALRQDLAEIGRALTEAMPRRAIETLESEVRALSERVGHSRQAGAEGQSLAAVEQELAEVRDALRHLTPAESLIGFEDAVRALSQKIDMIAEQAQAPGGDPRAFKQLEQAVTSLRGVVSNVASDGALAQLSAEVHGLAAQFERAAAESSSEALTRLESRIAAMMESGRAVPPELEGSIRELSERLDRAQLSQGDQLALGALEDRIAKLSEKLEASNARLSQLDAVERGLADLLVHLQETKSGSRTLRAAPPAEPQPEPAIPHRPAPPVTPAQTPVYAPEPAPAAAVESPLDLIPEMVTAEAPPAPQPVHESAPAAFAPLAPRAAPLADAEYMPPPAPQPRPRGKAMPGGPARQPIDPNLPPDTPLEPGSGAPRVRPGSAAARIAASEAALSGFKHSASDPASKSAAIAAARNAAKSAYLDTPVKAPKQPGEKKSRGWFKKKSAAAEPQLSAPVPMPSPMPAAAPAAMPPPLPASQGLESHVPDAPLPRGQRVRLFLKRVLIATCVAVIVVGTAMTAMDFLFSDVPRPPNVENLDSSDAPKSTPNGTPGHAPSTTPAPSRPMPSPQGSLIVPQGADPEATGQIGNMASFFDPSTVIMPKPHNSDVTGSIGRKTPPAQAPAKAPEAAAATGKPHIDALPVSISPVLRHALAAGDPAAEYELGIRYAEGRGLPQSTAEAARWLERAAHAGFAPAQFRLAGLNEKGDGLKKDVPNARKLYLAAAGKGHAKAMHNLAVLYAEGVDGKPDYKAAAQWFQKASNYGVTDSQYNLAILYARGIGISANLAESYRWFALAAAAGDGEAAKKRDEVAARLDQKTLAMAKAAVQGFTPDREPDEAINLKAPPGGWDKSPAAQAKATKRPAQ